MRLLVIGKNGQVAHEVVRRAPADVTVTALGRDAFDITDLAAIPALLDANPCDAVLNAAAYTAVDKAESERDVAFLLNADAPGAFARACAERGVPLVHLSTDYVFDGAKSAPYAETDPIAPQSVYGASKAAGEEAVRASGARAAIVRTSWVYASHGGNFLRTMLRLAETREELGIVADQLGRPTWAADLAEACIAMARKLHAGEARAQGVFHYAGAGDASWADFAEAIFAENAKRGAKRARVNRITTADYPTPAKRPANSRLDTSKIEALGIATRDWRVALALCMDEVLPARR